MMETGDDAQGKLAELLVHPDDLASKLPSLRAKFLAEKAQVESLLKSNVQSQLDDTEDGMQLLSGAHSVIDRIRSNLATVDSLCANANTVITNYAKIKRVSKTHQNFIATKEVVQRFQALQQDIQRVADLIERDSQNILGPAENLLVMHQSLFRLEEFRDQTIQNAKSQGSAVMQIVVRYFKRLDAVSDKFREYIWNLTKNLLQLIRENQGSVVVRLLKIIEVEEKADERVNSSSSQLLKGENFRTVKNYRSQMFNILHETIMENFLLKMAPSEGNLDNSLNTAKFIFEDLALVSDELAPRFPSKYKVFPFFVLRYHKHVYDLINRLITLNLDNREILLIIGWVRDYYFIMSERLGVGEELLEPHLLGEKEQLLTQDYIMNIKKKLWEWVERLLDNEATDFQKRERPPEIDSESTAYVTSGAVILFTMINQQIDIVINSAKGGRLTVDVASECFRALKHFQDKQLKLLETEFQRYRQGSGDVVPGFPEYVMAFSNNHMKCQEFTEKLQKRLEASIDEKLRSEMSELIQKCLEGFMKVSKRGVQVLIDIVFHDLMTAFQQMHTTTWYEQNFMGMITTTLDDYFQDFQKHLQDYLFTKLTTEAMDRFLIVYIESLKPRGVKFRMPVAAEKMKADLAAAIKFWSEYKTPKRVKQAFDIFEKLVGIIDSSPTLMFLSWYTMWKMYNDVPLSLIEELWMKRDDIEKSVVKEAIQSCKQKAKEPIPEATTSIFTKMATGDK